MFKELAGMAAQLASLSMTITLDGANLTVIVVPKTKAAPSGDGAAALATPLVLTGTPDDLDNEFADLLQQYRSSRQSLTEQLQATTDVMDAAKKSSAAKAVKSLTAPKTQNLAAQAAGTGDEDDEEDGEGDNKSVAATPPPAAAPVVTDNVFEL